MLYRICFCYNRSEMSTPTGDKKMVKVLATFPPPLHAALKAEADELGIPLTEHLRNIARHHVQQQKTKSGQSG
jgi:hypothetical protein